MVVKMDIVELLGSPNPSPFIKAIGNNETAPRAEGRPKLGFLHRSLCPSVDEPLPYGRMLDPGWNQPPLEHDWFASAGIGMLPDAGDLLCWGDVVSLGDWGDVIKLKVFGDGLWSLGLGVPAAHERQDTLTNQ